MAAAALFGQGASGQGPTRQRGHALKKAGILNKDISDAIAGMGHTDMLVICDAGFPIPACVRRIDVAVRAGLPGFLETVEAVAGDLQVARFIVAEEAEAVSPKILPGLSRILGPIAVEKVPHARLKELAREAVAVIRTGEFTPYANVILVSGVVF